MFIRPEVLGFSGLFNCSFEMLARRSAKLELIILLCVSHPVKYTALKPILCIVRLIDHRSLRVFRIGENCPCPFPHLQLSARLAAPLKAEGQQSFLKREAFVESKSELL